jgi:WD40 repeat protein
MSEPEQADAAGAALDTAGPTTPFPSLAALRAAHASLLRLCQQDGYTPPLLERAALLIGRGVSTGALLDDEADRDAAQSLLDYWSTMILRAGREVPDATLEEFDPSQAPELPDAARPYLGLNPFHERDEQMFFGRRRLVEWLVAKLAAQPMLALVGPSGSGKSSVIRAGLIPALRAGALPGSAAWRYLAPFTPGAEPLVSLARELRGLAAGPAAPPEETTALAARLQADPSLLAELLRRGDAPAVFVVDQFEELFTLCEDEAARQGFIAALIGLLERPEARHVLILTMRSDFESFIATAPAVQAWFEKTRVQLLPLNAAELREAIEKPAELVGLKFEPGVVDALLHDMLGEPAALPLLQFTLLKLWEHRERNRVTWEAYRRVGGGRLALARSADAFYNGLLPEDQVTARRILLRIVRPGEGLEITSNPVRRETLYRGGEAADRVDRVLEKLFQAHLLRLSEGETEGSAQVELAHEALVRNWPTLVQWLEDERAAVATRRRLEAKAAEWVRLGRGQAGLLDEGQLAEAARWLESAEAAYLGYEPALADLVNASRGALEEAERQRREAEQRELRQAQELAESRWIQSEQNRQLAEALRVQKEQAEQLALAANVQATQAAKLAETRRRLSLLLAVVCGLAIAAAIMAVQQAFRAGEQQQIAVRAAATAQQAAGLAQQAADLRSTEAVALQTAESQARENARVADTSAAEARTAQTLAETERARAERERLSAQSGRLAAEAQAVADRQPQLSLLLASEALNVTLSADKPLVPVAEETLRAQLARVGGRGLFGHTAPLTAAAVSADGGTLVTASEDGTALVWNLGAPQEPPTSLAAGSPVALLALSPDGRWLATTGEAPDTAQLWDLSGQGAPRALGGHSGDISALTMSGDGRLVATGAADGTVRVWNTEDPAAPPVVLSARGSASPVRAVALSADSAWALAGSDDGVSRLWSLSDPTSPRFTRDRRGPLTSAAISPDGRWLVTGSADGDAHLWQLTSSGFGGGPYVLRGRGNPITTLAIDPESRLVACGTADGTVRLWDLGAQQNPLPVSELRGHTGRITALAISPAPAQLLSASADGTASLWDLTAQDPGTTQLVLRGHEQAVSAAAISADRRWAITGSADGSARVWALDAPLPAPESLPADARGLIGLACTVTGRNMTEAEWSRYLPGQPPRATCAVP